MASASVEDPMSLSLTAHLNLSCASLLAVFRRQSFEWIWGMSATPLLYVMWDWRGGHHMHHRKCKTKINVVISLIQKRVNGQKADMLPFSMMKEQSLC